MIVNASKLDIKSAIILSAALRFFLYISILNRRHFVLHLFYSVSHKTSLMHSFNIYCPRGIANGLYCVRPSFFLCDDDNS